MKDNYVTCTFKILEIGFRKVCFEIYQSGNNSLIFPNKVEQDCDLKMMICIVLRSRSRIIWFGAVTRCGSGGSSSDNVIKHGWELKNDTNITVYNP
jgi:hypothetical protein